VLVVQHQFRRIIGYRDLAELAGAIDGQLPGGYPPAGHLHRRMV
jgi:hypothetical protein